MGFERSRENAFCIGVWNIKFCVLGISHRIPYQPWTCLSSWMSFCCLCEFHAEQNIWKAARRGQDFCAASAGESGQITHRVSHTPFSRPKESAALAAWSHAMKKICPTVPSISVRTRQDTGPKETLSEREHILQGPAAAPALMETLEKPGEARVIYNICLLSLPYGGCSRSVYFHPCVLVEGKSQGGDVLPWCKEGEIPLVWWETEGASGGRAVLHIKWACNPTCTYISVSSCTVFPFWMPLSCISGHPWLSFDWKTKVWSPN